MKTNFENEIEHIEKPTFVLNAHKNALYTKLHTTWITQQIEEKDRMGALKSILQRKYWITIMVVFLVMIASFNRFYNRASAYFVTLQINPSLEIVLDREERVIKTTPLNEEAKILLSYLDLDNKKIDLVFEEIIHEAYQLGYVGVENQFEISVRDARNDISMENVTVFLTNIQAMMITSLKKEGLTNSITVIAITKIGRASWRERV